MFNNATQSYLESQIGSQAYNREEAERIRREIQSANQKQKDLYDEKGRMYRLDKRNRRLINKHIDNPEVQKNDALHEIDNYKVTQYPGWLDRQNAKYFTKYNNQLQRDIASSDAYDKNRTNDYLYNDDNFVLNDSVIESGQNPEPQTGNNETTESGQPTTHTSSEAEQQIQNDQTQKQNARATWNNINHKQMQDAGFSQNDIVNLQRQLGVKADGIFGMQSAKALQKELKSLGLYDGPIDGKIGKKSIAGIKQMLTMDNEDRQTASESLNAQQPASQPDYMASYGGENDYYDDSQGGYYGPKDREYARGGKLSRKYGKPYKRSKDAEYFI